MAIQAGLQKLASSQRSGIAKLFFNKANIALIWGLILGQTVAEHLTISMLMVFLVYVMKKPLLMVAITVHILDVLSSWLAFVFVYVAFAITDHFSVILFSTACYNMGLILLCISLTSPSEYSLLIVAMLLIALGRTGQGSILQSFLEYQLTEGKSRTEGKRQGEIATKIWWHIARIFGYLVLIGAIGNFSGYHIIILFLRYIFQVSPTLMVLVSILFYFGNRLYQYENPTKTSIADVFKELKVVSSCNLLLLASFISYGAVMGTGNTIFITQVTNLKINLTSNVMLVIPFFVALKSFTSDIVNFIFWRGNPKKKLIDTAIRICAGMACSVICCFVARQVEIHRLHTIKKEGLMQNQNPLEMSSMIVLWLTPQFILLGLMEGLAGGGLVTHFYDQMNESIRRSFSKPLSELVVCLGKYCNIGFMLVCNFWFGKSINDSKVDMYFLVLAMLSCVSFCLCLLWWWNVKGLTYENVETNQEGIQMGQYVGNVMGTIHEDPHQESHGQINGSRSELIQRSGSELTQRSGSELLQRSGSVLLRRSVSELSRRRSGLNYSGAATLD